MEVEAARLGTLHFGGENDLAVRILDANGKELGRNDDSALYVQDPVLSIVAPKDGAYFIEIQQQIFYPPQQAWYRAHIGDFSRPTAIFPAGGQAGTTIDARILGDPAGERTEQIALPAKPGNFDYFTHGGRIEHPPSANVLRVSPYPNVHSRARATRPRRCPRFPPRSTASWQNPARPIPSVSPPRKVRNSGIPRLRAHAGRAGGRQNLAAAPRIIRASSCEADDSRLQDLGYASARGSWYIKDQQDPIAGLRRSRRWRLPPRH